MKKPKKSKAQKATASAGKSKSSKATKGKVAKVKTEKATTSSKPKKLSLDDKIRAAVLKIVSKVDLEKMTMKAIRPLIEKEVGVSLKEKRKTVKREVLAALQSATLGEGTQEAGQSVYTFSAELSDFLNGEELKRTQIVKRLWQHIRDNNLQNPDKKTEIINDEVFEGIFKCKKMGMFHMNKLLSQHIKSRDECVDGAAKSASKSKSKPKPRAKGKAAKNSKSNSNRNSAFRKPLKLSKDLEAVTGPGPMGRTDVVKNVWNYIRKHDLQNPENRKEILTDDTLAKVMGGESKLSVFHISKHLQQHLSPVE